MNIPNHRLRGATSDAGFAIDSHLLPLMEDLFGRNLRHIRLHRSKQCLEANQALGSVAFVVGQHICLRPGIDSTMGPLYLRVLAHELTHVVQKELGARHRCATATPCAELEAEANEIADTIMSGRPVNPRLYDPSPEPRCWGPAGHYWTIYFVCIAAGLEKQEAMDNAFYAQMPDQVDELDATQEGFAFFENYPRVFMGDAGADRVLRTKAVQMGLHALSGWSSEYETKYRTNILKTLNPGSFEFALALHPFGDSFAHRLVNGGERMYYGPIGHLQQANVADCTQLLQKRGLEAACLDSAYGVDNMNRRDNLYPNYGLALYDVLVKTWGSTPVAERSKVEDYLYEVMSEAEEDAQALKLRILAAKLSNVVHGDYDPNDEPCVPWKKFHANHPWVSPDTLDKALRCAAQWSGSY